MTSEHVVAAGRSRVLIVDSDAQSREEIRGSLEREGFAADAVASTDVARERLTAGEFQIVLSELSDDPASQDLLRHIRTTAPEMPVVVMVGASDVRNVGEGVRAGAFDYLRKPIHEDLLVDAVRRATAVATPGQGQESRLVLVVEDDPLQRRILTSILQEAGNEVRSADSLSSARAVLDTVPIGILVTDVGLGDESGLDLLSDIQRRDRELPVVMITAATDAKTAIDSLRAGAFEYLQKPYTREAVLDAVHRGLERRALSLRTHLLERRRLDYERRLEKLGEDLERLAMERTRDVRRMHLLTKTILRSIPSGIVTVSTDRRVTSVNASARKILELSGDACVGLPLESTGQLAPIAPFVGKALESAVPLAREEIRIPLPGGRSPLIEFGVSLLAGGEGGHVPGAVIHFADITDKRAFEGAMIQADKFAALGQMASSMAHDINGPLTVILGFAEMLRPRLTGDPVMLGQMDKILSAARHCEAVIANLLKFSRNEKYQLSPIDLGDVVQSVVALVDRELYHRSIKMEAPEIKGLPKCMGNAAELRQLLFNLFLNARDAMPDGGTIRVEIAVEDSRLRLSVADTGQGMPPDVLRDIFRPFFTTKPVGRGTGLGLSICAAIIARHGGQITADSTVGLGTTFTIHLPVAGAPAPEAAVGSLPTAPPAKLRVLVVDDDEGVRQLCQAMIESMSSVAIVVPTGEAALEMLGASAFDCVLADINLPGMDGMALCVQVRLRNPGLPVAIMSGSVTLDRMMLRTRWGAFEVLQKPFSREGLAKVLGAVAAQKIGGGGA